MHFQDDSKPGNAISVLKSEGSFSTFAKCGSNLTSGDILESDSKKNMREKKSQIKLVSIFHSAVNIEAFDSSFNLPFLLHA